MLRSNPQSTSIISAPNFVSIPQNQKSFRILVTIFPNRNTGKKPKTAGNQQPSEITSTAASPRRARRAGIKWPDGHVACPYLRIRQRIGDIKSRHLLRCKDCRHHVRRTHRLARSDSTQPSCRQESISLPRSSIRLLDRAFRARAGHRPTPPFCRASIRRWTSHASPRR